MTGRKGIEHVSENLLCDAVIVCTANICFVCVCVCICLSILHVHCTWMRMFLTRVFMFSSWLACSVLFSKVLAMSFITSAPTSCSLSSLLLARSFTVPSPYTMVSQSTRGSAERSNSTRGADMFSLLKVASLLSSLERAKSSLHTFNRFLLVTFICVHGRREEEGECIISHH